MMIKENLKKTILVLMLFTIALAACRPQVEDDPEATEIGVVEPEEEEIGQTAAAIQVTREATISFYQTESARSTLEAGAPEDGSPIPTEDLSPSSIQQVTVLVQANCRFGPGTNYGVVLGLFIGESAVVLGVASSGNWYYIQTVSDVRCWILNSLVSEPEDASALPVLTPPPAPISTLTPTPIPTSEDIGTPAP